MLRGQSAVLQALLGTFFTWGLTAAGAALVFIFSSGQRRILDGSLGFAAGVMLAASYWSLLAPAIEMAMSSGGFGAFAFLPVAVGFTLGAAFVYLADLLMPHLGAAEDPQTALALSFDPKLVKKSDAEGPSLLFPERELSIRIDKSENGEAYQRRRAGGLSEDPVPAGPSRGSPGQPAGGSWRRITLLILAITIHNVPEGLAVGVGFGAIEKTASATFESARVLQQMDEWDVSLDLLMAVSLSTDRGPKWTKSLTIHSFLFIMMSPIGALVRYISLSSTLEVAILALHQQVLPILLPLSEQGCSICTLQIVDEPSSILMPHSSSDHRASLLSCTLNKCGETIHPRRTPLKHIVSTAKSKAEKNHHRVLKWQILRGVDRLIFCPKRHRWARTAGRHAEIRGEMGCLRSRGFLYHYRGRIYPKWVDSGV
ncbi:zinc transporter ZIP11 isoform X1 [Tenrec ecaudatus]|uniref:zinc transporter ZIP11 isoform X1 n=1 Tax=Tenrec ecaudatus TaxID=94439 RepID=UPI003F5AC8A2